MENLANININCDQETRPLSLTETFYVESIKTPPPVGVYFHAFTLNGQAVVFEKVRSFFFALSKLHKFLRCVVKTDSNGDNWFLESHQAMNEEWYSVVLQEVEQEEDWLEVIGANMNASFDLENGPLWRVLWMPVTSSVNTFVLVFICFHGICDGKSVNDLIVNQYMSLLLAGEDSKQKPMPLILPTEQIYHPEKNSYERLSQISVPWYLRWVVDGVVGYYNSRFSADRRQRFTEAATRRDENKSSFHTFSFDADTSAKFDNVCKDHGCSVHAALLIVLRVCAVELALEVGFPEDNFRTITFPIDVRRFVKSLAESPLPLGQYTSTGKCSPKLAHYQSNWNLFFVEAEKLTAQIRKQIKLPNETLMKGIAHLAQRGLTQQLVALTSKFPQLYFSNLGKCGSDKTRQIHISSNNFGVSSTHCIFLSSTTYNGVMSFCCGYDNGWFTQESVCNFSQRMVQFSQNFAHENSK